MINLSSKKINLVEVQTKDDHDLVIHDIDKDIYLKKHEQIDIQSCNLFIKHEINESFISQDIKLIDLNYNIYFSDENFKIDEFETYLCHHDLYNHKSLLKENFYVIKDFYMIDDEYYVLQFI